MVPGTAIFFPFRSPTVRPLPLRAQHGAVTVAHAAARGQERVFVEQVGVGVDRDGRDVQLAAHGPLVERLDVLENVLEAVLAGFDLVVGECPEHEGVVGIGTVAQRQMHRFNPRGERLGPSGPVENRAAKAATAAS